MMDPAEPKQDRDIVRAPWTLNQVDALNRFQQRSDIHPFTCPHDHGSNSRILIATINGWICPNCDYTQVWTHGMMLEA
jgi:hypothetical protein